MGEIVLCATTYQNLLAARLNYLMLPHAHKERTDALDMQALLTGFIGESEHRCGIFATSLDRII